MRDAEYIDRILREHVRHVQDMCMRAPVSERTDPDALRSKSAILRVALFGQGDVQSRVEQCHHSSRRMKVLEK